MSFSGKLKNLVWSLYETSKGQKCQHPEKDVRFKREDLSGRNIIKLEKLDVHNSQKVETTQISSSSSKNKQNVVYPYSRIFGCRKEWSTDNLL